MVDPGRPPKWVVKLLEPSEDEPDQSAEQSAEQPESESIGGRMQSTRQSGRYSLRRRVAPPPPQTVTSDYARVELIQRRG